MVAHSAGSQPETPAYSYPATFDSTEAVRSYVNGLWGGGKVELVRVEKKEILVLYANCYGRVTGVWLAAYSFSDGKWHHIAEMLEPDPLGHAEVRDGALVVVSASAAKGTILVPVDKDNG